MAFSTQKDFFYVPFMNENVDFECRRACVQLKSYDSTIDDRSWALDERQRSNFLSDLVACRTPIGGRYGRGEDGDPVAAQLTATGPPVTAAPPQPSVTNLGAQGAGGADANLIGDSFLTKHGIRVGDSVLECANATITKLEAVLVEKQILEKELEVSNERLRSLTDENMNIKNIMQQKFDSSQSKDFYNKIQQLSASGKIGKCEENELLAIHHKMEDMIRGYEILQAENCYLKRLVEKLACRASMQNVKQDPETSTDVGYLQDTVNNLRKEVNMLRKLEDEKLKIKYDQNKSRFSDRDTENIKAIIKERNILREKCKTFKDLEKKVQMLQKKTKDADQLSDNLSNNLDCQSKYICEMEQEMKRMQTYYEEEMQKCKFTEEMLKCQIEELKEQLMTAKCCAQRVEVLQMELACLRNEITKRDVALSDYDCQYKQLMEVIDELKVCSGEKKDDGTQTCGDAVEELAFFASATLNEIQKELEKRCSKDDVARTETKPDLTQTTQPDIKEQFEVHAMEEGPRIDTEPKPVDKGPTDDMCADLLKRLKELEDEAARLKAENDALKQSLKEKSDKLNELADKLGKIDKDMANTAKETAEMGKDLDQSLQLVKDISDIQVKNQQLATAVNAINSMDDQKLIDDLKAQLEALRNQLAAEQDKNKRCQEEKERFEAELKNRGIPTDDMKQEAQKPKDEPQKPEEKKAEEKKPEETKAEEKKTVEKHDEPKQEEKKVEKHDEPKQEEKKVEKHDEPKQEEKKVEKHDEPKQEEKKVEKHDEPKKVAEEKKKEVRPSKVETPKPRPTTSEPRKTKDPVKTEEEKPEKPRKTDTPKPRPSKPEKKTEAKTPTEKRETGVVDEPVRESQMVREEVRKSETPKTVRSPSKSAERPTVTSTGEVKKVKDKGSSKTPSVSGKPKAKTRDSKDGTDVVTTDFVTKNAPTMAVNLKAGCGLEKELRAILDAFIEECGFCFCQCRVPKSKFYGICFNLLHYGLQSITFKELAYMHKKIFTAAERIHPGCLLSMILSDASGPEVDRFKCCVCRNALCCSNSEAMLREKVGKLEREIEMAKEYLDYFKAFPEVYSPRNNVTYAPDVFDFQNEGCLTYRTTEQNRSSCKGNSRQLKKLKERVFGASDFML